MYSDNLTVTTHNKSVLETRGLLFSAVSIITLLFVSIIFMVSGDIYLQILSFLMVIFIAILSVSSYKFYKDIPWGWYALYLSQGALLLGSISMSYLRMLFDLIDSFYLKVVKGISLYVLDSFNPPVPPAETYTLIDYINDIFFAADSFIATYSIFIGFIFLLVGLYWGNSLISNEYSDVERTTFIRRLLILILVLFLLIILGIYILYEVEGSTMDVIFGGIIGLIGLGFSFTLYLTCDSLTKNTKDMMSKIIIILITLLVAFYSFDLLISFIIIYTAAATWTLRHPLIKKKFDTLWTQEQREERTAYMLMLPTASVVLIVVLVPVIWVLISSFFNIGLSNLGPNAQPASFAGINNYMKFLTDDEFYTALVTTILYTICGTLLSVGSGVVAAILINREFRGRGVVRTVYLFPYIASTIAMIFLWTWAVDVSFGFVNEFLVNTGMITSKEPWLDQQPFAFIILVIFQGWKYFPFAMLMFLAQLQSIDGSLYEAADIDGANEWQKFWNITLPELSYVIGVVTLLRVIWTFNKFDDVFLFTKGSIQTGTLVIPIYIFDKVWKGSQFVISEATPVAVFVVIGLLSFSLLFGRKFLKW